MVMGGALKISSLMTSSIAKCSCAMFLLGNLNQRRYYSITRKGLEYLDAYKKIEGLVTYFETEPRKQPSGVPIDIID